MASDTAKQLVTLSHIKQIVVYGMLLSGDAASNYVMQPINTIQSPISTVYVCIKRDEFLSLKIYTGHLSKI